MRLGAPSSASAWFPGFLKRFTEPKFWVVQASVLVITAVHIAMEGGLLAPGLEGELLEAHHLPVVFYIAPVAYAGLSYGWEGGVLTALWAGALASINIVIWHVSDFEWITELAFVLVVITLGVLLSIPVERERVQRRRAETAARRLETVNQVLTATTMPDSTPEASVKPVLGRLVDLLDLRDVGVALWRRGHRARVVEATVNGELDPKAPDGGSNGESETFEVIIETEHVRGRLVASAGYEFGAEEKDLLATIGQELAVRAENAMLVHQEQEMLSTYVRLVTKAQEEERRRFARELHDGAAQQLAMLVRDLKQRTIASPDSASHLEDSASEILEEVRRVARDQRPTLLDDLGLVAALEWLVDQVKERSEARVDLTVSGSKRRLPVEVEVALYRIAQEAVRNAERHAEAETIRITMRFDDVIEMSIEDDGRGFDTPLSTGEHVRSGRLGLMGMQERSQLIGADLEILTKPGRGTTVNVRVPLNKENIAVR